MGRNSCCTKQKLRKGLWSPEEDEKLFNYITRFGVGCWSSVPKLAGLQRCGKSCRLRWINYLRPDLKRGMFSQQEEDLIINLHKHLGNRWAQIAAQLPGRTDNEIKNFWNSSLKKKLMKQGIDPTTHQPLKEEFQQGSKNDNISSSEKPHPINGLLPPPIMAVKPQQPIFLDTCALTNNEQILQHYGAGHFMIKPLLDPSSSHLEPGFEPMWCNNRTLFASQDNGFGLPCLANLDQNGFNQNPDFEFSDASIPRVDSLSMYNTSNEAKESSSYSSISSNINMGDLNSTGALSDWDQAKLESLLQYDHDEEDDHYNNKQISGIVRSVVDEFEDRKPENPWQMERIISLEEDEQQLSSFPLKFMSEDLGSTNFDIFQQL